MALSPGHLSCTIHTKEKLPRSPLPVTPGLPPLGAGETRGATTSAGRCMWTQGMGCRFTSGCPHSPLSMPTPVALRHAHTHPPMRLRVHPAPQTPEPRHAVTRWAPTQALPGLRLQVRLHATPLGKSLSFSEPHVHKTVCVCSHTRPVDPGPGYMHVDSCVNTDVISGPGALTVCRSQASTCILRARRRGLAWGACPETRNIALDLRTSRGLRGTGPEPAARLSLVLEQLTRPGQLLPCYLLKAALPGSSYLHLLFTGREHKGSETCSHLPAVTQLGLESWGHTAG